MLFSFIAEWPCENPLTSSSSYLVTSNARNWSGLEAYFPRKKSPIRKKVDGFPWAGQKGDSTWRWKNYSKIPFLDFGWIFAHTSCIGICVDIFKNVFFFKFCTVARLCGELHWKETSRIRATETPQSPTIDVQWLQNPLSNYILELVG